MKAQLEQLIRSIDAPLQRTNVAREYLQARLMAVLQRGGAFIPLAFQGGTALRFLYNLPRHSEDLDFTLEKSSDTFDFEDYISTGVREFMKEGYVVDTKVSTENVVQSCFFRFRGLLHDLGLSSNRDEVLSIKLEVDTHPPMGAILDVTTVRKYILLRIQHHDRSSLLAGKIHAVLNRKYTKGRDIYDLLWYLSDRSWPEPNLDLLNNALNQTGWDSVNITPKDWKSILAQRVSEVDWKNVRGDVLPFLEHPEEADLLDKDTILGLLK